MVESVSCGFGRTGGGASRNDENEIIVNDAFGAVAVERTNSSV